MKHILHTNSLIKNIKMSKKIQSSLSFFALLLLSFSAIAQTTHPVELGFNVGASWLQSDVKMKKLGGAGGFTLGQMYLQNDKSALDWGWRFRYLNAVTYGQDTKKSGIANNPILNGTYDSTLNYNSNGGILYQNYKTNINELGLELVIGANRMRNKTKVYPYVFGGIGITKAVTKTNQLDGSNLRYDYFSIDSNGTANGSQITSSLNTMYDGTYETAAEGSESPRWKFMPSVGVGLGYQFTPGFSMGLEHKMTWAMHDGLDGQQWNTDNTLSATKDKYHYSSVWLKFSFGRTTRHTTTTTTTNNNTTNIVNTTGDKPVVNITTPSVNSFTSSSQSFTVRATVKNVTSKSDITLLYNGVNNSNFTYDATTHSFAFPLMLLQGSNTFNITATNANGNTTDNATVLYETQVVVPPSPAPIVTITSPTSNPHSTTMNNATVVATVLNVAAQSQIGITINGVATSSFIFNPSTHGLTVSSNLNPGANTFVISATNASGSDSKSITVIYSVAQATPPPFVTFVNPGVNPFTSSVSVLPINAMVQNVTSVGQIAVSVNGGNVPTSMLSFNPSTSQLSFNANLMAGANSITIAATNVAGADSKSITVMYSQPVAVNPPPVVTIVNPSVNPYTSAVSPITVNALVQHVTSVGQISVTTNVSTIPTSMLSFNPTTGQLNFNVNLAPGANTITIGATNVAGADSKSTTVIYSQPVVTTPAPIVTITAPSVNPFNTTSNVAAVNAIVLNVTAPSQIAVSLNGVTTSAFAYNIATKQLVFNASLIAGANIVTIAASNTGGSDSKSTTIIYSQPVATPAPIVTITSPTTNPFNTAVSTTSITASVLNVTASSQITATLNGANTPFTYNMATKQLSMPLSLIAGANMVTITATTPSGSDAKSTTIIYTAPVATPAPIVTITSPTTNPLNTSVVATVVNATVLNVTSSSQITGTLNGANTPFTYNMATKQVSMPVSLIAGANMITITATTPSGSDSKSTTIIYTAPVVSPAPVVTITSPATNPFNTSVATTSILATVLNVTASSQITATVNGANTPFTYNMATKQLTMSVSLITGANIVTIAATTPSGSDSKSATIIYTAPVVLPSPIVTFIYPAAASSTFGSAVYNVEATVLNITSISNVVVKLNGVVLSTATYNSSTKVVKFPANLVVGVNTITITATNTSGTDTRTVTIKYSPGPGTITPITPDSTNTPANPGRPNLHTPGTTTIKGGGTAASGVGTGPTITFSVVNPYATTTPVVTISAVVAGVTMRSDIIVKLNGVEIPFSHIIKTNTVSVTTPVNVGANTLTITATNAGGTKTETLVINR